MELGCKEHITEEDAVDDEKEKESLLFSLKIRTYVRLVTIRTLFTN